jgi:hypothetical protein
MLLRLLEEAIESKKVLSESEWLNTYDKAFWQHVTQLYTACERIRPDCGSVRQQMLEAQKYVETLSRKYLRHTPRTLRNFEKGIPDWANLVQMFPTIAAALAGALGGYVAAAYTRPTQGPIWDQIAQAPGLILLHPDFDDLSTIEIKHKNCKLDIQHGWGYGYNGSYGLTLTADATNQEFTPLVQVIIPALPALRNLVNTWIHYNISHPYVPQSFGILLSLTGPLNHDLSGFQITNKYTTNDVLLLSDDHRASIPNTCLPHICLPGWQPIIWNQYLATRSYDDIWLFDKPYHFPNTPVLTYYPPQSYSNALYIWWHPPQASNAQFSISHPTIWNTGKELPPSPLSRSRTLRTPSGETYNPPTPK